MPYAIQRNSDDQYVKRTSSSRTWTSDFDEATTWRRQCDAIGCARHLRMPSEVEVYNVIEVERRQIGVVASFKLVKMSPHSSKRRVEPVARPVVRFRSDG